MTFPLPTYPVRADGVADAPNVSESQSDRYLIGQYVNPIIVALNALAVRVGVLETGSPAPAPSPPPTVRVTIGSTLENQLLGVPVGTVIELVGPTTVHELVVQ